MLVTRTILMNTKANMQAYKIGMASSSAAATTASNIDKVRTQRINEERTGQSEKTQLDYRTSFKRINVKDHNLDELKILIKRLNLYIYICIY